MRYAPLLLGAYLATNNEVDAVTLLAPETAIGREGASNINAAYWLQGRSQQVLNASNFNGIGTILIEGVSFRTDSVFYGPLNVVFPNISVRLSTTQSFAQGLSRFYDDNIGPDVLEVLSGSYGIVAPGMPGSFNVTFLFETPFPYDPGAGNLLIEFRFFGSPTGFISEYLAFDRIGSPEGASTDSTSGLLSTNPFATSTSNVPEDPPVLLLHYTPTPEPSTAVLAAFGFTSVLLRRRRFADKANGAFLKS